MGLGNHIVLKEVYKIDGRCMLLGGCIQCNNGVTIGVYKVCLQGIYRYFWGYTQGNYKGKKAIYSTTYMTTLLDVACRDDSTCCANEEGRIYF